MTTIDESSLRVRDGASYVMGSVQASGKTATFTPSVDLDYNTTYTVSISDSVVILL